MTWDVREILNTHRELSDCAVNVTVRGGVAHLSGTARSTGERRTLREAVTRVRGILAVWEALRINTGGLPCVLDIGCGGTKQQSFATGVDQEAYTGVNVVCNLESGLPFRPLSVAATEDIFVNLMPVKKA